MNKAELEQALEAEKSNGFEWARRRDQAQAAVNQARDQLAQAERAVVISDNQLGESYHRVSELEKQLAELEKTSESPGPDPSSI